MMYCLVCDKHLESIDPEVAPHTPDNGIVTRTLGNYGSGFWDEIFQDYLEFYVCDECLKHRQHRLYHADVIKHEKVTRTPYETYLADQLRRMEEYAKAREDRL